MSRPFSADYFTAQATAPMVGYAVAYMVWGYDAGYILGIYWPTAKDEPGAQAEALAWLKQQYPECKGYLKHTVKAQTVTAQALAPYRN